MLILGLGLGFVMQVLVLAVQNAVPYSQLGIATSSATLFRSIGGSLGTAILGAIFSNRLAHELAAQLPAGLFPAVWPRVRSIWLRSHRCRRRSTTASSGPSPIPSPPCS